MMADEKMARWEDKMTAGERRILMNNFVSKYLIHLMAEERDDSRIGVFEHTGCLITMLANDDYDNRIRPQEMPVEIFTVQKVHSNRANQGGALEHQIKGQDEDDAAVKEERRII